MHFPQPARLHVLRLPEARHVIHFYLSPEQRDRFVGLFASPRPETSLVLATPRCEFALMGALLRQNGVSALNVSLVELTRDWRLGIGTICDALQQSQPWREEVILLADFGTSVCLADVYQAENMLAAALSGRQLRYVTQYDAGRGRQAIDVQRLRASALVVVGDYFYKPILAASSPRRRVVAPGHVDRAA